MPLIDSSTYQAKGIFKWASVNTIYPALFRVIPELGYIRERIHTPDGDFLDLDWSRIGSKKIVLVLHGLEGQADRPYVKGMIRHFNENGWDGLGMNYRGCSGEPNLKLRSYHMAATADVALVVNHIITKYDYDELAIVGFSLGGNLTLRYLAEIAINPPAVLKKAVAFSVPCDISSANIEIHRWHNYLYLRRFLKSLNQKIQFKAQQFPEELKLPPRLPRTFYEFDDRFTGPMHGYVNGADYYQKASSLPILASIKTPVLLVNAQDDTFLSPACYPIKIAKQSDFFFLEMPAHGGHVGFAHFGSDKNYWSERRAFSFITSG
ncbi:MAG: alpha/beta fold hydrolase [Saprospiraceae bacterium]